MISYQKAIDLITGATPQPRETRLPIDDAVGHVLAEDIVSTIDVAPFRNSSKDGYALQAMLTDSASPANPITLLVEHTAFAGDVLSETPNPDAALKIMTGAMIPDVFDAVIPVEDCRTHENAITITQPVSSGDNVRPPGEDSRKGELLFSKGHCLTAIDIGVLASIGMADVCVYAKPTVLLVNTGNEVQPVGSTLKPGHIYDSNRHTASSLLRPFCRRLDILGPVRDDREELTQALDSDDYDVIITTGGVSAGDCDYVPDVAESIGWQRLFHKVAIKPGMPLYVATQPSRMFFGLPGNPLSVAVTLAMFVIPALRRIAGDNMHNITPIRATLTNPRNTPGKTLIWPGILRQTNGKATARLSGKTSSASLTALSGSDGLVIQADGPGNDIDFLTWAQILGSSGVASSHQCNR